MAQETDTDSGHTIEWLNHLIVIAQRGAKLPFYVARLVAEPAIYQEFLAEVRSGVPAPTSTTQPQVDSAVGVARERLLKMVAFAPLLHELFGGAEDPFAGATHEQLKLLAHLSDITTDPQTMFNSRNGTFLAVVEALRQSRELDQEPLILDWLTKFLTLLETNKPTAKMLFDLACSDEWYLILAALRDDSDYAADEDSAVAQKQAEWNQAMTTDLRGLLFKPGHLSRAPAKLIKLAWEEVGLFDEARAQIPAEVSEPGPVEVRKQVAERALGLLEAKRKEVLDKIEEELSVLAIVAESYINIRKFAKLNGLDNGWPELSIKVRANYANFEFVEECLVNRIIPSDTDLDSRDARALYTECKNDERLIEFLKLRPYFREIDDDDLRDYRPLPPVVISDQAPKAADTVSGVDISRTQTPPPTPAVSQTTQVSLTISRKAPPVSDGLLAVYDVSMVMGGHTLVHEAKFSTQHLLNSILAAMGVTTEDKLQSTLKEFLASSNSAGEALMARGAAELQRQIFSEEMQTKFSETIASKFAEAILLNSTVRLTFMSDETELHYLPWEWLTQVGTPGPLLTYKIFSVVRAFSLPPETLPTAIIAPVKLLSIMPSAPSGRRFNSANTVKVLDEIKSSEPAEYKSLIREDATLERIITELDAFEPHIVHFEGYLLEASKSQSPGLRLVLSKPDQEGIPIEDFGALLKAKGVQLLVFGRNGISRIFENTGAIASFQLIKQGLPALIGPIRAIDDSSATNFTSEFYRAFLQGNSLEAALHVARRKLVSKGGDWSVFALFADPSRLDKFTILRPTA
jgi:hypothetical protein